MKRWNAKGRRPVLLAAMVVVAIAVAVLLIAPLVQLWGLAYHETCESSSPTETGPLLTPVALLNSPFKGFAQAVGIRTESQGGQPVPGLAGELNASNGSTVGLFSLNDWTIVSFSNQWTLGPGSPSPCTSSESAQILPTLIQFQSGGDLVIVPVMNDHNTTDDGLPDSVSSEGYSSVEFDATLPSGSTGGQGTCSMIGIGLSFGITQIDVRIASPLPGVAAIPAVVPSVVSYEYELPGGGNWIIAASPSAGLAFSYYPCP